MRYPRVDHQAIASWIKPGERVLDLGCGDGSFLNQLIAEKKVLAYGVENEPDMVLASIKNNINVLQLNLEKGLAGIEDGFFDHVVMSLSLQAIHNIIGALNEMLRVGREAAVSFPNFGYKTHREAIARGHMPVSESLPHQWYNTPNVRFFTIADFDELCQSLGIKVLERRAFENDQEVTDDVNYNGSLAVYRLSR